MHILSHVVSTTVTVALDYQTAMDHSGGSRNLERGVQQWAVRSAPEVFGLPRPLPDINTFVTHVIIVATDR